MLEILFRLSTGKKKIIMEQLSIKNFKNTRKVNKRKNKNLEFIRYKVKIEFLFPSDSLVKIQKSDFKKYKKYKKILKQINH